MRVRRAVIESRRMLSPSVAGGVKVRGIDLVKTLRILLLVLLPAVLLAQPC